MRLVVFSGSALRKVRLLWMEGNEIAYSMRGNIIWIILGALLDPMGMLLITIPVFFPIIRTLGVDPVWFGILFIVNCEMAYVTPPFGFNLFYLKSIVPSDVSMADIYRSVIPFVGVQFLCLVLIMYFPEIALWLPSMMLKQ